MQTLRFRIALVYAVLIIVAMAALGTVLARAEAARFRVALDDRLLAEARLIGGFALPLLREGGGLDQLDPLAKRSGVESGAHVTIIAADGVVLGDSVFDRRALDNQAARPEVADALAEGNGRAVRSSDTERRQLTYVAVQVGEGTRVYGAIRTALPSSAGAAGQRAILIAVAIAAGVTALGGAALALAVSAWVTRPLEALRRAVRTLADGALDPRVTAGGSHEVQEVGRAFNEMAGRMTETVTRLGEERSRLEALLAAGGDALIALDHAGTVRYLNPTALALFGPAAGKPLTTVARNYALNDLLRAAGVQGARVTGSVAFDSTGRTFEATLNPITGGGDWATLLILQDVTELRRVEATRRDFVANVSHELRTPLAGIKAVVETLQDGALHDPVVAEQFLENVDAEVDRLVHLVEELLQLSRIESGAAPMRFELVAPESVVHSSVDRFRHMAERASVRLSATPTPALPPISADPERLGQALGNLVHNAVKFTPEGGVVSVGTSLVNGYLQISVADSGIGMDAADLPRIFERFYIADRARAGRGTGLGLAIVKHVVRAHGGTVEVTSALGRGSTFTISLPVLNV